MGRGGNRPRKPREMTNVELTLEALERLDDVGRVYVVLRLKRPEKLMLALLARLERDEGLEGAVRFLRDTADKFEIAASLPLERGTPS
jgi:hypothetical protein